MKQDIKYIIYVYLGSQNFFERHKRHNRNNYILIVFLYL